MAPPMFRQYAMGIKRNEKWIVRPLFTFGGWEVPMAGTGTLSADNLEGYMDPWWQYILRRAVEWFSPRLAKNLFR